ncbi:MucB/RseB C-terminal domain-containing protein [Methylophilus medardicus]|uniref:Transcriptional regulator n=1 Tax=Methylophilus medardicus TaxID=2588534 RepID=A0A5B8CUH3_9PROT|nr:MucB/RseB C-terminal domain-containing protein [Methylophilus medardicus]QDC44726.1 transcriptional regulator [Methylophilus medardicus]QDC49733.1 transcriptional regulator [Methylophilus medardicus]QDC53438.1 transcriptional regulator [Methylophilus medardicus]
MSLKLVFRAFFLPALLLAVFNQSVYAEEDLWVTMQKTASAARELNYQGLFVYHNGATIRSVQITHMYEGGREFSRNVVLDGRPREVFSEGDDIVIFNAKNDKIVIEKRRGQNLFPAMLPTQLYPLKQNYKLKYVGQERIAGRLAQVIDMVPNDNLRYQYRVWSDAEYGLLLKMSMVDAQGHTLEQIGFNQVSMLQTKDLDWFQPKIDATKPYVMDDSTDLTHIEDNLVIANLPTGYKKVDQIQLKVQGKNTTVQQLIFSDGLASVSLFVEPIVKGMQARVGKKNMGSTNVYAHVLNGYQLVVVGEVPAQTVEQIAQQVTFKK